VGPLDFVLTDAIATYVDKFDYPPRQCIPLPKLVVRTAPAQRDDGPVDDVVFVSNASGTVEGMIAEAVARFARNVHTQELISRCCRSIVGTYERGETLSTYNDVCGLLRRTMAELGLSLPADGFDVLARWLTHPFNDALYRQQALCWAADATREQGLTLALYGKGWDAHAEFAPYARGPVEYGEPLRRLTRRSRINLQIVPYLCLHQRLLDGLSAGGFFLVREHVADVAPQAMCDLLSEYCSPDVRTLLEARASVPPPARGHFDEVVADCRRSLCPSGMEDPIEVVRSWEHAELLVPRRGVLPHLRDVSFTDEATLTEKMATFLNDTELRRGIAADQRASVSARLTYEAGLRRMIETIRGRLAVEAPATAEEAWPREVAA
jgi:hypothetical protein